MIRQTLYHDERALNDSCVVTVSAVMPNGASSSYIEILKNGTNTVFTNTTINNTQSQTIYVDILATYVGLPEQLRWDTTSQGVSSTTGIPQNEDMLNTLLPSENRITLGFIIPENLTSVDIDVIGIPTFTG